MPVADVTVELRIVVDLSADGYTSEDAACDTFVAYLKSTLEDYSAVTDYVVFERVFDHYNPDNSVSIIETIR